MIISFTNVIGAIRNVGKSIITSGLKMWLGFETSSISGANQITPDLSNNSNVGQLFTGKALDFNGSTDSVDCGDVGANKILAFWFNPTTDITSSTGAERLFGFNTSFHGVSLGSVAGSITGETLTIMPDSNSRTATTMNFDAGVWYRVVVIWNSTNSYYDIYVNGELKTDLVFGTHTLIDWSNFLMGVVLAGTGSKFDGKLSNVQIYNAVWSASDIAYDYAKPNHLVTDNPSTSITVTNLKGYWALSEGDGSVAYDSSGEGNNGTINGATYVPAQDTIPQLGMMDYSISTPVSNAITLVANPSNPSQDILGTSVRLREHAFNLDGSGYAEVADDVSLDFGTGTFSCDGWVKFKHVNTSSINCIYSNGGQIDSASNFGIGVTSNKIVARVSSTALSSSTTFSEGEWVYFALTRDGSGACKLYINDDTTPEGTASNAGSVSNPLDKQIGRDSSAVRFYQNLIDDVRVYNIELTSDEINNNYNVGLPAHSAGSSFSDDFSGDYGN